MKKLRYMSFREGNGKRISGPVRDVYLNDPREVQPDEVLTEIYAPLDWYKKSDIEARIEALEKNVNTFLESKKQVSLENKYN